MATQKFTYKKISCGQSYMLDVSTYPFSFPTGLQLLLHTRSIFSAISFIFAAISFSSEALFHDSAALSHIKYSAALLLPWALKKPHEVGSDTPVQIHLKGIFFIPNSWWSCRDSQFCISPQTTGYENLWPSFPKPMVGRGGSSNSYPLPLELGQSPHPGSKSLLSPDSYFSPRNFYLVAGGFINFLSYAQTSGFTTQRTNIRLSVNCSLSHFFSEEINVTE